jgi:uncharacterized protein YciI
MEQYVYFVQPPRPTFAEDATPDEEQIVSRHYFYLANLLEERRLLLAGPCLDAYRGIGVLEAGDEESAREIVDDDPAVVEGLFTADLHPFKALFFTANAYIGTVMKTYVCFTQRPRSTFHLDMTAQESEIVDRHREYLKGLFDHGSLALAGPCTDGYLGFYIFEAANQAAAQAIVDCDPAVSEGLFTPDLHAFNISLIRGRKP